MNRINPDGTAWSNEIWWTFVPPVIDVVFLIAFVLAILAK
jgi:hypothetical protein